MFIYLFIYLPIYLSFMHLSWDGTMLPSCLELLVSSYPSVPPPNSLALQSCTTVPLWALHWKHRWAFILKWPRCRGYWSQLMWTRNKGIGETGLLIIKFSRHVLISSYIFFFHAIWWPSGWNVSAYSLL